ncbi:MAG TPA: PP2C family protein-serine/threonine phosphatase [Terriglobales bacterium]|nr:PP2C family protein-serine/threonine phosphatase [Terriglobales bacterium]
MADSVFLTRANEVRGVSPAFRQSLLRSEKKRAIGIILFLSLFAVLMFIRIFVLGSAMSPWGFFVVATLIAFELGLFHAVNQALNDDGDIPHQVLYLVLALESLCPAVGIAFAASSRLLPDYRPLATPWVLAFFPFILLSVLRLRPRLCLFSGVVSSLGYLGAAYYVGWRFIAGTSGFTVTQTAVLYFALILLVTGVLAGGIAMEIRTHVEAGLREAETRAQLRQVEHELQIARSIQQSLLPKFRPQIAGFQVAGWSRTANDTGGDFYDWKRVPDGRWVVILADVTGHGIGPAILASVCRAYSRASFNVRDSLETTLRNINHSFAEDLTPERFATFVAAVFEEASDQVELLSAGHGPLFVYSSNSRSFQFLNAQTLPLGILPDMQEARPIRISMKPGDIILLITDGFFEWENPSGELFGTERLAEIVRRYSDLEPEIIVAELYQAVLNFSQGTPQQDDLTAVLIKRVHLPVRQSDKPDACLTTTGG